MKCGFYMYYTIPVPIKFLRRAMDPLLAHAQVLLGELTAVLDGVTARVGKIGKRTKQETVSFV